MKNKELQTQIENMIVILNDLIDQVTSCEIANESLSVEIHNLKTSNVLLSQERDQLKEDLQDLRQLRTYPPVVEKEEDAPDLTELYARFAVSTRPILEELRKKYGRSLIDINEDEYRDILLKHRTVNINTTLKILATRKVNGHPAVTLYHDDKQDKKLRLLNFKFNY